MLNKGKSEKILSTLMNRHWMGGTFNFAQTPELAVAVSTPYRVKTSAFDQSDLYRRIVHMGTRLGMDIDALDAVFSHEMRLARENFRKQESNIATHDSSDTGIRSTGIASPAQHRLVYIHAHVLILSLPS